MPIYKEAADLNGVSVSDYFPKRGNSLPGPVVTMDDIEKADVPFFAMAPNNMAKTLVSRTLKDEKKQRTHKQEWAVVCHPRHALMETYGHEPIEIPDGWELSHIDTAFGEFPLLDHDGEVRPAEDLQTHGNALFLALLPTSTAELHPSEQFEKAVEESRESDDKFDRKYDPASVEAGIEAIDNAAQQAFPEGAIDPETIHSAMAEAYPQQLTLSLENGFEIQPGMRMRLDSGEVIDIRAADKERGEVWVLHVRKPGYEAESYVIEYAALKRHLRGSSFRVSVEVTGRMSEGGLIEVLGR